MLRATEIVPTRHARQGQSFAMHGKVFMHPQDWAKIRYRRLYSRYTIGMRELRRDRRAHV